MSVDPSRRKLRLSLASLLSGTASVETRQEGLKIHLRREVMPIIEPSLGNVTTWIQAGLPAAFAAPVIDWIIEKLKKDEVYSSEPGSGGAWNEANFYAKGVPKDHGVIQTGNVALLNGLVEKVLQCDISDTSVWMRVPEPDPEFIVPDWPKDKRSGWYPKRTGLLGDWGYGEDFNSNTSAQRDNSYVITGIFPFQATQLMAWEGGLDWAGPFTGHSVQHDLEAFAWLMWTLCINLDGPFNRRRFECGDYYKAIHRSSVTKRIKLEALERAASKSRKNRGLDDAEKTSGTPSSSAVSSSTIATSGRTLPSVEPPSWARPGLHNTSPGGVAQSKIALTAKRLLFTSYLSPYFSKHSSVVKGFQDLFTLFNWKEENLPDGGGLISVAPAPSEYKIVIDIIKEMRDGIKLELDAPPSKEEIAKARKEISALLDKGHLETPLLGSQAGPSQSQSQTKKRSRHE